MSCEAERLPGVSTSEAGFTVRNSHYLYTEGICAGSWSVLAWNAPGMELKGGPSYADFLQKPAVAAPTLAIGINGTSLKTWRCLQVLPEESGASTALAAVLQHERRRIQVVVHCIVDDGPVLARRLEIRNLSSRPLAVTEAASFSGLCLDSQRSPYGSTPGVAWPLFEVGRFQDDGWGQEGRFGWEKIHQGFECGSVKGRSGFGGPFLALRNSSSGEILLVHLAWSANWRARLVALEETYPLGWMPYTIENRYLGAVIGLHPEHLSRVLQPAESAFTPWIHLCKIRGSLDEACQAMQGYLRRRVLPATREPLPVASNSWYSTVGTLNEEALPRHLQFCRQVGAEAFVFDAGWYRCRDPEGRFDWCGYLGDWQDGENFPSGMVAACARVRQAGLKVGVWMEPEVAGHRSRLLREHPDWFMARDGVLLKEQHESTFRCHLDLSQPQVAGHVETVITDLCARLRLDWLKLDYNISIGWGGTRKISGIVENVLWRSTENWYRILDSLRRRFPDLIIEACSSGGGRNDLGTAGRSHSLWISDVIEPASSLDILNGLTLAFPPSICHRMLGALGQPQGDVDFSIRAQMLGQMSISCNPTDFSPQAVGRIRRHLDYYKTFLRPLLQDCLVFHHTPVLPGRFRDAWVVLEYASPDRSQSFAGIFRLASEEDEYRLFPRGIDPARRYRLSLGLDADGGTWEGSRILQEGLRIRLASPYRGELLRLEGVPRSSASDR